MKEGGTMGKFLFLCIILIALFMLVVHCVRIVPQSEAYVVERLGQFSAVWDTGMHLMVPFIERITKRVNLKEQVMDSEPFAVITKDNVKIQVDTVVFFQISDPKLFTYGVVNPVQAIQLLTNTVLRDEFGRMDLDESLVSRDKINKIITEKVDVATDKWGIKVNSVELKDMIPPTDIQEAMEKQMRAERERREAILLAEGEKNATILKAEGEKQSKVLRAEADKQSKILQAEADKEANILAAQAEKEASVLRAEGYKKAKEYEAIADAEYLLKIREAEAEGYNKLSDFVGTEGAIRVRGYESLEKIAEGESTKLIIPSELQGTIGTAASLKEVWSKDKKEA